MNVLFPIDEAAPLYKVGGLGDVGGALPKALTALGYDVRIILPKHPEIILPDHSWSVQAEFTVTYNRQELPVRILNTLLPGTAIPVYLIEENKYLSEHTGASDNHADKFAVFSLATAVWISSYSPYWQPHIIHCHDWHTALIPVILQHKLHQSHYKTIITIHNLAYQGVTQTPVLQHLDIDPKNCQILSWDTADGDLNILLEGLLHADFITTVSPTYAKEILTDEYGEKINAILESKKIKIRGILNGLDTQFFDPAKDPMLKNHFDLTNWQTGKAANRQEIQTRLNLPVDDQKLMISFIGRVDPYQKGIGLIIQALRDNLFPPAQTQFVFLGTGDPQLEKDLHQAAGNQNQVRIVTRFDEPLAHVLYAASHVTLIPSRFEPCGLVQLSAMRYGCLPVARATGGLADTIVDHVNGFLFPDYSVTSMMSSLNDALDVIKSGDYNSLVDTALKADHSWLPSAKEYGILYEYLVTGKTVSPKTP